MQDLGRGSSRARAREQRHCEAGRLAWPERARRFAAKRRRRSSSCARSLKAIPTTPRQPHLEALRLRVGTAVFSDIGWIVKLEFALLIPDFEVSTSDARRVLPKSVPLGDAVITVSNACAIAGAFASRDYEKLVGCFDDRLHQPFRLELVPFLTPVIEAGRKAGALGGWLSGSGSTVACVSLGNGERVAGAMLAACKLRGARVMTTRADNAGVRISVRS